MKDANEFEVIINNQCIIMAALADLLAVTPCETAVRALKKRLDELEERSKAQGGAPK